MTMKLEALRDAVEKWRQIERGEMVDAGIENCTLCFIYNTIDSVTACKGCPVSEFTGQQFCEGTPYQDWAEELKKTSQHPYYGYVADTPQLRRLARAERLFLMKLFRAESAVLKKLQRLYRIGDDVRIVANFKGRVIGYEGGRDGIVIVRPDGRKKVVRMAIERRKNDPRRLC